MKISKYLLAVMFSSFVLSACATTPSDDSDVVTGGGEAAVEETMVKGEPAVVVDEAMKIEVVDDEAAMDDEALD